jgi:hypothetical protein
LTTKLRKKQMLVLYTTCAISGGFDCTVSAVINSKSGVSPKLTAQVQRQWQLSIIIPTLLLGACASANQSYRNDSSGHD